MDDPLLVGGGEALGDLLRVLEAQVGPSLFRPENVGRFYTVLPWGRREGTMGKTRRSRMPIKKLGRAALAVASTLILVGVAAGQEMPLPKPGPEHKVLEMDAGSWDATVEMSLPGAPPMVSKGTETNTMGCGGLCLISDFKGTMGGAPFHGHGTTTWDPARKKYVGTWTDSMSAGIALGESTYDAVTKTASGSMEGPDMTGKIVKSRSVVEYKDANTRVMQMFTAGPDGKEIPMMKISYTRKN
jgi:hypothetical protein